MIPDYVTKYLPACLTFPSFLGPSRFGCGPEFLLCRFRNNSLWLIASRRSAHRSSPASRACRGDTWNYLCELFTLRRQILDLAINARNRHSDMFLGIAAS